MALNRPQIPVPPLIRDIWTGIWRDDVPFYAAGIAFHSLFSIFSVLFLLSLLLGLLGADPEKLRGLAGLAAGVMPDKAGELVDTILAVVSRPVPKALLPVAIMFTLWTSSNVIQALIHALNRIYHLREGTRAAWRTRLMALGVVGSSILLLLLGFVLLIFGTELSAGYVEIERWRSWVVGVILAARDFLSVIVVFLGALLLYWLAPDFKHHHRVSWPGALAFTVAWTPTTLAFNVYLRELAVYDRIYGPLATVVVVLVWVYFSAFLCLVGGEVNRVLNQFRMEKN